MKKRSKLKVFQGRDPSKMKMSSFSSYPIKVEGDRFGIEIEVETSNDIYPCSDTMEREDVYWRSVSDGSLRNSRETGQGGREFVSKKPITFEETSIALESLDRTLNQAGSLLRYSNRTSCHVHYNIQHLTPKSLAALFCLYYMCEPIFCKFNGSDRENNLFALPLYTTGSLTVDSLVRFFSGSVVDRRVGKYLALNINNIYYGQYGTIEFRHGKGVEESVLEVYPWVELINTFVTYAKQFEGPEDILSGFSFHGIEGFLKGTCPVIYELGVVLYSLEYGEEGLIKMEQDLSDSVRIIQPLCYDIDWSEKEDSQSSKKVDDRSKRNVPTGRRREGEFIRFQTLGEARRRTGQDIPREDWQRLADSIMTNRGPIELRTEVRGLEIDLEDLQDD